MTRPAASDPPPSAAATIAAIGLCALAAAALLSLMYAGLETFADQRDLRGSLRLLPATTSAGGCAVIGWLVLARAERRVRACAGVLGLLLLLATFSALGWKLAAE